MSRARTANPGLRLTVVVALGAIVVSALLGSLFYAQFARERSALASGSVTHTSALLMQEIRDTINAVGSLSTEPALVELVENGGESAPQEEDGTAVPQLVAALARLRVARPAIARLQLVMPESGVVINEEGLLRIDSGLWDGDGIPVLDVPARVSLDRDRVSVEVLLSADPIVVGIAEIADSAFNRVIPAGTVAWIENRGRSRRLGNSPADSSALENGSRTGPDPAQSALPQESVVRRLPDDAKLTVSVIPQRSGIPVSALFAIAMAGVLNPLIVALLLRRSFHRHDDLLADLHEMLAQHGHISEEEWFQDREAAIERATKRLAGRVNALQRSSSAARQLHSEVIIATALRTVKPAWFERDARSSEVALRLMREPFWCVLVEVDGDADLLESPRIPESGSPRTLLEQITDSLREEFEEVLTVSHLLEHRVIALIPLAVASDAGTLTLHLTTVRGIVERRLGASITMAIGAIYDTPDQLPRSYQIAQIALEHKFILGKGRTIWARDICVNPARVTLRDDQIRRLQQAVRALRRSAALEALTDCLGSVDAGSGLRASYTLVAARILERLAGVIEGENVTLPEAAEAAEVVKAAETVSGLRSWLIDILTRIFHELELSRGSRNNAYLAKIEELIQRQYANPLLQIADVARHFSLSPTYFGRFFHELTGTNFTSYVNEVRLRNAADALLNTEATVKEIAEQSGFNSTQYFIRVFKRRFGNTPRAFRIEQRGEGDPAQSETDESVVTDSRETRS